MALGDKKNIYLSEEFYLKHLLQIWKKNSTRLVKHTN